MTTSGTPADYASNQTPKPPIKPMKELTGKLMGHRHTALYWCVVGIVSTIFLVCGLLMVLLDGLNFGVVGFILAGVIAAMPVPIYLGLFLWLDRFEPEPPLLLAGAFFWGATVAVLFASCFNSIFEVILIKITGSEALGGQLTASLSAPLMEESLKGMAVLLIFLFKKDEFDGILDGIIYAGVTALGFAMVENVEYYGRAMHGGLGGLLVSVVLRGMMSPYTHVLFTSMTGIGFGLAVNSKNTLLKFVYPLCGWLLAMTLHFLWNSIPALGGEQNGLLVLLASYFVFWVPVFGILLGLVFYSLKQESKMIATQLLHYVEAGELTKEEAGMLCRLWPRMTGMNVGPNANTPWGVRRKYTRLATTLAFYRHRVATGHTKANAEIEALELTELRIIRQKTFGFPVKSPGPTPA